MKTFTEKQILNVLEECKKDIEHQYKNTSRGYEDKSVKLKVAKSTIEQITIKFLKQN